MVGKKFGIERVTTEKEFALMSYEAHWFGNILRSANARLNSGLPPEDVLTTAMAEWRMVLNTREEISDDWEKIEVLVRDNAETDYLAWRKHKHPNVYWGKNEEADAREQFKRFRLARTGRK